MFADHNYLFTYEVIMTILLFKRLKSQEYISNIKKDTGIVKNHMKSKYVEMHRRWRWNLWYVFADSAFVTQAAI